MTFKRKVPGIFLICIPIFTLIGLLFLNIEFFKNSSVLGPNQIALFISAVVSATIGIFVLKIPYKEIEKSVLNSIHLSLQAMLILLVVGMLIGIWIYAGIVPAMIYYGVKIFHPTFFLPLSCLVCCIISLATGSSWSTGGTIGIALVGVGDALGIPTPMVAGAVISGAYFGDKLSPLSDTTNLAPAMAGTELFIHVRYMLLTTTPSILIALAGFTLLGMFYVGGVSDLGRIEKISESIYSVFNINPYLFTLPILVLVLIIKKIPALPALIVGCFFGAIFIILFQKNLLVSQLGPSLQAKRVLGKIIEVAYKGFQFKTKDESINALLSRGGMTSMLNTVWLIFMSMTFGGVMEVTGMMEGLTKTIMKIIRGPASLIIVTLTSSFVTNFMSGDQYLSIVFPGRMFKSTFDKFSLAPQNLSRALEDGGTITSVLIPWNSCGAYFATILGVSTYAYLPFCFFNLVNPFVAIIIAMTGFKIKNAEVCDFIEKNPLEVVKKMDDSCENEEVLAANLRR